MLIILLGDLLQQPEKKQIYTYEGKWPIYGINFSNKPEKNIRLAMGSFIEDTANKVEIIMLDEEKASLSSARSSSMSTLHLRSCGSLIR